jgi:hypothetical protein
MKWRKIVPVLLMAIGFGSAVWAQVDTRITYPQPNNLITKRSNFPVSWSIANFDSDRNGWHYWISIASVTDNGEPDLQWPKFYVKEGKSKGQICDGGQNPFPNPQPMLILLLRVDDSTNQRFSAWIKQGVPFPGLPVNPRDIVARVPIRFP